MLLTTYMYVLCLFIHVGAGAYAGCTYCTHLGTYSKILQKMVYPGNRRFLPQDNPMRTDARNFPSKAIDEDVPPEAKDMQYVDLVNEYAKASSLVEKKRMAQKTGCKGEYRRTGNVCEVLIIANCEIPPHSQTLETHKINPTMNTSSSTSALQEEPHRPRCLCGKWPTTTPSYMPATALGSLSFRLLVL